MTIGRPHTTTSRQSSSLTLLLIANPRDQKVNKNQNQLSFNKRLELIPTSEMGRRCPSRASSPWKPQHQYHHNVN
ncbi:hypothetical protein EJD97_004922 [Solanum chilense]|uniref:Uncharacterized protein n=1 Tax=Solanum chilense TaxID=4083 RepID=A0A6N2BXW0_SOLCI|nr:hypothetical protein EJD97_004922 [Solanum chilense]